MTRPLIWYIHGAYGSPRHFNFICAHLPEHDHREVSYTHDVPLAKTVATLKTEAAALGRPLTLIGHSLGGVLAAAVAQGGHVARAVSIGSPHGGVLLPPFAMFSQLGRDVLPSSAVIRANRASPPLIPFLAIITRGSHPTMFSSLFGEENDGVVSVSSQRDIKNVNFADVRLNHLEALLSTEVVDLIKPFVFAGNGCGESSERAS